MKANIINIGNSQGIILPAALLRKLMLSFKSSVQIEVNDWVIARAQIGTKAGSLS